MLEIWEIVRSIPRLEVSNLGNVRCSKTGRPWYIKKDKIGYLCGQYKISGKRFSFKVHRLVAEAFLPNPENKPEVNHKDGVKHNSSLSNLEWCTRQENIRHAFDTGLNPKPKGSLNGRAVLSEDFVHELCKWYEESSLNTPKKAVEVFGISIQQASKIRCGIAWKHISCQYKIEKLKFRVNSND